MSDNNSSGSWIWYLLIPLAFFFLKNGTLSDWWKSANNKIRGVEVLDEQVQEKKYKDNNINYTDRDNIVDAIERKFENYSDYNITIKKIKRIGFDNSYKKFSIYAIDKDNRNVIINGYVKKKNGKFDINYDEIVLQ